MRRFIEHRAAAMGGYLHTTPDIVIFMAECLACGAQKEVSRDTLKKAAIGMEGIHELGSRLRCGSCGEKNGKLMTGFYVAQEET